MHAPFPQQVAVGTVARVHRVACRYQGAGTLSFKSGGCEFWFAEQVTEGVEKKLAFLSVL